MQVDPAPWNGGWSAACDLDIGFFVGIIFWNPLVFLFQNCAEILTSQLIEVQYVYICMLICMHQCVSL